MKRVAVIGLLVCLSAGGACANNVTTSTYTIVDPLTEVFQGSLAVNGSAFYSFVVGNPDPISVTFASLTTSAGQSISKTLQLGIGKPAAESCAATTTVAATPQLVAQYLQIAQAGTYCVIIKDTGALTETVNFAIRIKHS